MKIKRILTWICLVLWMIVGVMAIFYPVSQFTFFCCLTCLILRYVEYLAREYCNENNR